MEATIYGSLTKPAVMVVGTWDPLVSDFFILIEHINDYCKSTGYELLLVLLDPSPQNLLQNSVAPIYDCCEIRVKYLSNKCYGAIATFSMNENELDDGVEDFLEVFFKKQVKVSELWLYDGQTMGRGGKSTIGALTRSCAGLNVAVKTIPPALNFKTQSNNAKKLLAEGRIEEAAKIVGHFSLWQKPGRSRVSIGWKEGTYEYYPAILTPGLEVQFVGRPGTLDINVCSKGYTVFDWPDNDIDTIMITRLIA